MGIHLYDNAMALEKIISGGQTGADRAALDWAIENSVPHGGWCPQGRRAEDGVIPKRYTLEETPQADYSERTKWNIRDADATLIVTLDANLNGGSLLTRDYAQTIGKPCLHVILGDNWRQEVRDFFQRHFIRTLNVAGPRASSAPGIERLVYEVLDETKALL